MHILRIPIAVLAGALFTSSMFWLLWSLVETTFDASERAEAARIEAEAIPQIGKVQKGIEAIKGKNRQWFENSQIHGLEVNGPFPNGDQFIVHFTYDVTPKQSGKRMTMSEMGLYTVRDGKIAKEEFFYSM